MTERNRKHALFYDVEPALPSMSIPPAAKKCKASMNAPPIQLHRHPLADSCPNKQWRQILDSFNVNESIQRSREFPIAIPSSLLASDSQLVALKVCDLDGIKWMESELGSFFLVGPGEKLLYGRRIVLSKDGERLLIEDESKNHMEVYECLEGMGWKALEQQIPHRGREVSLSADGSRIAVLKAFGSKHKSGVTIFECGIERRWVQVISGDADWGALVLDFLGTTLNQVGQSLIQGEQAIEASFSDNGNTIAVRYLCAVTDKPVLKIFRYSSKSKSISKSQKTNKSKKTNKSQKTNKSKKTNKGAWVQIGQNLLGIYRCSQIGWPLSINGTGDIIAVLEPGRYADSTFLKVYHIRNNRWKSMGKALLTDMNGLSSVCVAPNTNRIVVSTVEGHVNIYDYDGKNWTQVGDLSLPSSEALSGVSMSFSSCGDQLAIGSLYNDPYWKGRVRIFKAFCICT